MKPLLILFPFLTCTRPIDLANSAKKLDTIKKFFTNMLDNSETIIPIGIIDSKIDFPYDNNALVQLYYLQLNTLKGMGQVTDGKDYIYTFMDLYNKFVHWDMMDQVLSDILRYIVNTNKMLCEVMPINTSIDTKGEFNPNYLLLENIPLLIDAKNSYISKIKSYIDSNLFTKGLLEKKIDIEAKINYGLLLLINDMNKASLAYLKILQKIGQDLIALDSQIIYDELKESYDKTLKVYLHGCTTPTSIYSNIKMSIDSISTYENEKITPKSNLFEVFPKLQGRQIFYEAHMSYLYSKLYLFTKYLEFTTAHYKTIITEKKLNVYLKRCFTEIKTKCEKHLQTCNGLNYNFIVDINEFVMDEIVKAELQMMLKDIWKLLVNCQELTKNLINNVVNKKTKTEMRGALLR